MRAIQYRLLVITAVTVAAVAGALLFEALLSIDAVSPFGHTCYGHAVGWGGLAVILLVFVYPLRKRYSPARSWPRGWFRMHMVAGILGPLLIFLHSGAHYHALVPVLAMASMVIVVLSGIVGQAVHALALRTLNDQRHRFQQEGLSESDIDSRLHSMASQEEAFRIWQAVHAPMTLMFLALTVLHVGGTLFFAGFL
jgi:hypothetical protein